VRYTFIHDHRDAYSVTRLCGVMKVSCRGFYDWVKRPNSKRTRENQQLLEGIRAIFGENKQVYGAPRIHKELVDKGFSCSLNRVARLMRAADIVPKTVRKFRITTDSRQSKKPAGNLLDRNFATKRCNEKWVADVTYIPTREGWLFLAAVMDLFSRRIVGWSMSDRLTAKLSIDALQAALDNRGEVIGLTHHSDQGKEYYASDYQTMLKEHHITCSMSRKGNCWDNAAMESFFHSLKVEQVHHDDYRSRTEARSVIFEYIELFYNRKRRHSSIRYMSPIDYERWFADNAAA